MEQFINFNNAACAIIAVISILVLKKTLNSYLIRKKNNLKPKYGFAVRTISFILIGVVMSLLIYNMRGLFGIGIDLIESCSISVLNKNNIIGSIWGLIVIVIKLILGTGSIVIAVISIALYITIMVASVRYLLIYPEMNSNEKDDNEEKEEEEWNDV